MLHLPLTAASRRAAAALIILCSGTLLGCPEATVDPDPSPIGLALVTVPPGLAPGGEAQLDVVVTRQSGFTGAVTLQWFDQTGNVSAQDVVIAAGQTIGRITFHDLNGNAKLGLHTIHIVGSSAGVRGGNVDFYLTVAVAGTVTMNAFPTGVEALRGVDVPTVIAFTRANYTQPITLTVTPPAGSGISATVTQPGTTSTGSVILLAAPSTPLGDYEIAVKAVGANLADINYSFRFTVTTSTYTMTASSPTVPLVPGPVGPCNNNCARLNLQWNPHPLRDPNGFPYLTAGVDITGAAAGVDVTVVPFTTFNEGNQDVLIAAGAAVPTGTYQVTITTKSFGQLDKTATIPVQVLAPQTGSFTMSIFTAPLGVVIGTPKPDQLDITRTNFNGPITITGTADHAGIGISALNPVTGSQTIVTFSATGAVPLGTHSVTLTGTSGSLSTQITFSIIVAAAPNPIAKIVVGPTPIAMAVGGQPRQLAAQLLDAGGLPTDGPVGWSADVTTIASVDGFGLVTAVGPGTTAITATNAAGTVFGRALVSVAAAAGIARINVAPIHVALTTAPGFNTLAYVATAVDVSGVNFVPSVPQSAFLWQSSNNAVATVDAQGGVTAVGTGGAIISATKDGQRGEGAVSVGSVGAVKGSITSTSGQYLSNAVAAAKLAGTQVAQVTINQFTGQFYLPGLAPGTYQIVITVNGFPSQTLNATVTSGQVVLLTAAVFQ